MGLDNPTFHATIGWDWITSTPGREVGIWNDVWLSLEGDVHVSDPYVTTRLEPSDTLATMTPVVHVTNNTSRPVTTTVSGWIGSIRFEQPVTLAPQESRDVAFSPDNFPQLRRQPMRLWWPNGYGEPYLYDAGFSAAGDEVRYKAGIREVAYEDMDTALKIFVNHQRIMVMGGNWGFSETNLNYRAREFDAAVRYHRDMNMTMIRNWVGQTGAEAFFEACDRYGLMVWQDFWLANPWDGPDPADNEMFMDNARDFISRIRRHPSLALYCGRNEGYPPESSTKDCARVWLRSTRNWVISPVLPTTASRVMVPIRSCPSAIISPIPPPSSTRSRVCPVCPIPRACDGCCRPANCGHRARRGVSTTSRCLALSVVPPSMRRWSAVWAVPPRWSSIRLGPNGSIMMVIAPCSRPLPRSRAWAFSCG